MTAAPQIYQLKVRLLGVYRNKGTWDPTGIGRFGVFWRFREDDQSWLPCELSDLIAS